MARPPHLEARVRHRVGDLSLEADFALREPWTVLFGPSGAGKSTLLRILAGLITPDSGVVRLGDQTLVDTAAGIVTPPGRRGIGFLGQSTALFPHLDARANVAFGLGNFGRTAAGQTAKVSRINEMLALFRARELGERMPATLSGGERQRIALARALAPEPRLLLLDEPFGGLDTALKDELIGDLLGYLKRRNLPVLYVSHDLTETLQTHSDVIVLSEGRITAQGPASQVLADERRKLLSRLGVEAPVATNLAHD